MTDAFWEEQHQRYLKKDWIDKPTIFAEFAFAKGLLPASGELLDLGGGQGQDARYFSRLGFDVTLLEGSTRALELAREKATREGLRVRQMFADLADPLPFDDQSFDVIWSHLALHYFDEPTTRRLFAQLADILRPGGTLALMVNSADDPEVPSLEPISQDYYLEPKTGFHKRYFTSSSLQAFLPANFETILLDAHGETHKDPHSTLVRFIGRKTV